MTKYHDNMTGIESAALVAGCDELDAAYAAADAHDKRKFDEWVTANFAPLTRRTNYPKLGYIIHCLNMAGIPSLLHGQSRDAPILRVALAREDEAWAILDGNYHGRCLDAVNDDAPLFRKYADTVCDQDD